MSDTGRPEPQRLAKRLAAQLPCSRSDAENYIAGGFVRVDGVVVEEPMARVRDEQAVTLDPKAKLEPQASVTLIWHKPAGHALPDLSPSAPWLPDALATQWFAPTQRFQGDRSGVRPLKAHLHKLLPVAPLGDLSSGLMVFTQNPGVARKMSEDANLLEHEWLAEVAADPALEDPARREAVLQSLGKALFFDGWSVPSARASWQSELRLRLAIKGNRPGQVAHLCERAGLQLTALRRLRLGRVSLAGLPVGEWRNLLGYERF
jgi:23S rRNA pseudouridine2604 synthase